jgi:hypothetical protein
MEKGTKVVTHEGTGTGTDIFYKRGYGDGYYSTLPIGYPLPSLIERLFSKTKYLQDQKLQKNLHRLKPKRDIFAGTKTIF